ncbi:MAG TPA: ABC transporter permease subunit [Acidimicrobiales bacterium]|nr:ABC transporter permease subunit [Acidimicrobiales bacterium]
MIGVEARKQVWRLRTYVGLALVAVIPVVFTVAFKVNPPHGSALGLFDLTASGINIPIAALAGESAFLLIVVVSLFAGDSVSSEAGWGSLRYLLVRPISRNRLLGSKLLIAAALAVVATFAVSAVGLAVGTVAFGWHPVTTPTLTTVSQTGAVGRLALATLYVAWSQAAYLAFAFMLSTMTDSAFGAVAGGVGVGVVSQILNNISALNGTSYIYPTHYVDAWQSLFFQHGWRTSGMLNGIVLQVPYVVVFLALGWWWFNRKDVLS